MSTSGLLRNDQIECASGILKLLGHGPDSTSHSAFVDFVDNACTPDR